MIRNAALLIMTSLLATACGSSPLLGMQQPGAAAGTAPASGPSTPLPTTPSQPPRAPRFGPFIPAAAVLYGRIASGTGRPGNCFPVEEAARFHLLDLSMYLANRTSRWCGAPDRPLQAIRALNGRSWILLYRMLPAELNWVDSSYPVSGPRYYEMLRQEHGIDSKDRWFAVGERTGDYLVRLGYPQYMAMEMGNPNWRRYWIKQGWEDMWGANPIVDARGANGLFVDGAVTGPPHSGAGFCPLTSWNRDRRFCSDTADYPATYRSGGTWNTQRWRQDLYDFLREAVPWYRGFGLAMMFNTWTLNPDYAAFLSQVGGHAMEECGFTCGGSAPNEVRWTQHLNSLRSATNFAILSTNNLSSGGEPLAECSTGLACMDKRIWNQMRGWDALWFAMTSFLLAYDPQRQNGFFHFTAWGYRDAYWVDEYDPRYLHLGRPLGEAYQLPGGAWIREFEDGWVAVNPTRARVEVRVPSGKARVLNHDNFRTPASAPVVPSVTLEPWHGVLLLRALSPTADGATR